MFVRLLAGGLVLLALICGCSRSGLGPQGEVSGKVLYNGKPLPGGEVKFMAPNGYTFASVIDPDGTYKLRALIGESKIVVNNRMLKIDDKPAMGPHSMPGAKPPPDKAPREEPKTASTPAITGTYVALPERYSAFDASGLTYEVKTGAQTHDIELTP